MLDCSRILLHSKVNMDLVLNHFLGLDLENVPCNSGKLVLKKQTNKQTKTKFLISKLPLVEACCSIGFPAGASGSRTGRVRFYLS